MAVAVEGGAGAGTAVDAVLYAPLGERLWREQAELPAAGREAFWLFYDPAADELLATMRWPDVVGTAAERDAGERLYDRYFMASAGPTGTDRLGDLMFERGDFRRAAALWDAVLTYHSGEAVDPLRLRVKRAVALHRAGDVHGFTAAREALLARDAASTVSVGRAGTDGRGAPGRYGEYGGVGCDGRRGWHRRGRKSGMGSWPPPWRGRGRQPGRGLIPTATRR